MKILHVITSLQHGGAEVLAVEMLIRLKAMGAECSIAVFDAERTPLMRRLVNAGVTVHRFSPDGSTPYSPWHCLKLWRLIRRGKYDVVHTHNTSAQLYGAICANAGTALVTTEHNTDNRRRAWGWYHHIDQWMYSRYQRVVCISDKAADNLISHIGDKVRAKTTVITNGIDLPCFTCPIRPIDHRRPIIVTMVAGFREQKDQDTLVRAAAMLPDSYKIQLIGNGIRRRQVERLVKDLGLHSKIDFMGIRSDIPAVLRDTDITVMSSHYEGLSLASVEALASGRPLVASDVDGLREVVGGYGILFADGDDKALGEALLRLGSDNDYYLSTARACQRRAQDYDIDQTVQSYMDIYHQSLNTRQHRCTDDISRDR